MTREVVYAAGNLILNMTDELFGIVVGGVIGVVATLLGVFVTYWLTVRSEKRKERRATVAALTTCRLEAASVASALRTVGPTTLPPLVATEQVIRGGMLADLKPATARDLLLFSMVVHDLERTFVTIESLAGALISAGEGQTANATLVAWRDRSSKLGAAAAERAEVVVKLLSEELAKM
jgi:hypothetical protein